MDAWTDPRLFSPAVDDNVWRFRGVPNYSRPHRTTKAVASWPQPGGRTVTAGPLDRPPQPRHKVAGRGDAQQHVGLHAAGGIWADLANDVRERGTDGVGEAGGA